MPEHLVNPADNGGQLFMVRPGTTVFILNRLAGSHCEYLIALSPELSPGLSEALTAWLNTITPPDTEPGEHHAPMEPGTC